MTLRLLAAALLAWAILGGACVHAQAVIVDRSEIGFTVTQMGVKFDGRFRRWKADIAWQPKTPASSTAVVDVDLGSIDLASADSEAEAKGPLWFDTAKFPTAHFASTAIRDVGGNRYEVAGKLTIKGITRDCVIPIMVGTDPSGNRVAQGNVSLKRLDYKIGEGEWADPQTVAADVIVRIRLVLAPSS